MVTVIPQGDEEARYADGPFTVTVQNNRTSESTELESPSPPGSFFFRSSFYSPQPTRKPASCALTKALLEAHAQDAQNVREPLGGFISIPLPPVTNSDDVSPTNESELDYVNMGLSKEHPTFTLDITPDAAVKVVRFTTRPSARVVLGFVLRAKHASYPTAIFTGNGCSEDRLYNVI